MPIKPFRQITPALVPPALTDQVVGVQGGRTDVLWTFNQISEVIGGGGGGGGRTILKANANYYVSASGSDANDGSLANPWLTIQHGVNVLAETIDFASFTVTLNVGAGTFAGCQVPYFTGGGTFNLFGAGSTQTTITSNRVGGDSSGFSFFVFTSPAVQIDKFNMKAATAPGGGPAQIDIYASGLTVTIGLTDLRYTPSGGEPCLILGATSTAFINGTITIDGSAQAGTATSAVNVFYDGAVQDFATYVLVNSPNFGTGETSGFIGASNGGVYQSFGSAPAITGQAAVAFSGGEINGLTATGSAPSFIDSSSSLNSVPGTALLYPQATTILRTVLTGNTSFYVSATGSDSNNGSSSSPWATLTHAMSFISSSLDLAGFTVTVNIGAGTFVGFGVRTPVGGGAVNFIGAGASSTTIGGGPNDGVYNFGECVGCSFDNLPTLINLDDVNFAPTASGFFAIAIYQPGFIGLGQVGTNSLKFTYPSGTQGVLCVTVQNTGATVDIYGLAAITVDATASAASGNQIFYIADNAAIFDGGIWTMVGTPKFAPAAVQLEAAGVLTEYAASSYSGAATGQRFLLTGGSVVNGFGRAGLLGPTFFPGSTAGVCDYSSSYDGQPGTDLTYPQPTTILRTVLTANTNFYVSATGSDSNDGSSAHPWLTLQHAMNFISGNIDGGGFQITVNVGAGTFAGVNLLAVIDVQWLFFLGAGSSSTTLTSAINGIVFIGAPIYYSGFNHACPANSYCVRSNLFNQLWAVHPDFSTADIKYTPNVANPGFAIWMTGGFWSDGEGVGTATIAGGPWTQFFLIQPGSVNIQIGDAYTLTGTPNFSSDFIDCAGSAVCYGTFTGAATGQRFTVHDGGDIASGSTPGTLGPNFFPGNSAGIVDATSGYDGFQGPLPGISTKITGYTFAIADAFTRVEYNGTGAAVFTVPGNGTVAFEVGTKITMTQIGTGNLSGSAGGGVTVHNVGSLGGQWRSALLYKRGTDEWVQTNV